MLVGCAFWFQAERESPEHRPPDKVIEDTDPAEVPGKRARCSAVDESQRAEGLTSQGNPDEAVVSVRFAREKIVAVRENAHHHADDPHERYSVGIHIRDLEQRTGEQGDRAAPYDVVDRGRVEPASKESELVRHAATGRVLAMRSRIPEARTPAASTRSIHAGNRRILSSSMKSQRVMPISLRRSKSRIQAKTPCQVRNPRLPMMIAYAKSRAACRRSSTPVRALCASFNRYSW